MSRFHPGPSLSRRLCTSSIYHSQTCSLTRCRGLSIDAHTGSIGIVCEGTSWMSFTVVPHSALGPFDLVLVILSEALVAEHHVKYSSSVGEFQPYFTE